VLDYHLHLWPHSEHETPLRLEQLAEYCARAQAAGSGWPLRAQALR